MVIKKTYSIDGIAHELTVDYDASGNTTFVLDGVTAEQTYRHQKGVIFSPFSIQSGNFWAVRNNHRCALVKAGDDLTENGFDRDCGNNAFGLVLLILMWLGISILEIAVMFAIHFGGLPVTVPNYLITGSAIAISFLLNMKPIAHVSKRRGYILLILFGTLFVRVSIMLFCALLLQSL